MAELLHRNPDVNAVLDALNDGGGSNERFILEVFAVFGHNAKLGIEQRLALRVVNCRAAFRDLNK